MSAQSSILSEIKPLDMWSWEVVSCEFQQKTNLNLDEKPKELLDPIIKNYLVHYCKGCTEVPCLNYHAGQKPRREIHYLGGSRWSYSHKQCTRKGCNNPKCSNAHTIEEILYHPKSYKTTKCSYPLNNGECERFGKLCPYIHEYEKMQNHNEPQESPIKCNKFDPVTFKTIRCPITKLHNIKFCNFYHKVTDRRRNPEKYAYSSEACRKYVCPDGDICNKCHSNIEFLYHPSIFRTNPCRLKENCTVKEICPFYHIDRNDRVLDKAGEIIELISQCEELSLRFSELQEKNRVYKKFMCSVCFLSKAKYVLKCGHTKCMECEVTSVCELCQKPTLPFTLISL
ncbi:hypothetical protein SteCoe_3641 [Stentor coeruleus]|uniref:C3H1-type domain-containing protein n=1 Tax=Stentor coeruleus TaxID=5963 RepID=A0A1R2CWL3_9CILI|nr:hypothetical protein SteCoe_3641 [Stentor coeruleus]